MNCITTWTAPTAYFSRMYWDPEPDRPRKRRDGMGCRGRERRRGRNVGSWVGSTPFLARIGTRNRRPSPGLRPPSPPLRAGERAGRGGRSWKAQWLACIVIVVSAHSATAAERTEHFDQDPAWDGHHNRAE